VARRAERLAKTKRWAKDHPKERRAMSQRGAQTRRARKRGAFIEAVDPLVVYERDRGVCGICSLQITAGQKWHVDHIVPLSKGGVHSYHNVQLAHAHCNMAKATKMPKTWTLFQKAG